MKKFFFSIGVVLIFVFYFIFSTYNEAINISNLENVANANLSKDSLLKASDTYAELKKQETNFKENAVKDIFRKLLNIKAPNLFIIDKKIAECKVASSEKKQSEVLISMSQEELNKVISGEPLSQSYFSYKDINEAFARDLKNTYTKNITFYDSERLKIEEEKEIELERKKNLYSSTQQNTPSYDEFKQYTLALEQAYASRSKNAIFSALIDVANAFSRANHPEAVKVANDASNHCLEYREDIPNCAEISMELNERILEQFGMKP